MEKRELFKISVIVDENSEVQEMEVAINTSISDLSRAFLLLLLQKDNVFIKSLQIATQGVGIITSDNELEEILKSLKIKVE